MGLLRKMWPQKKIFVVETLKIEEHHRAEVYTLMDRLVPGMKSPRYALWKFVHDNYPQTTSGNWRINSSDLCRPVLERVK